MPFCGRLGHFFAIPRQPVDYDGVFHEAHKVGIFKDIDDDGADTLRRFPRATLDDHG